MKSKIRKCVDQASRRGFLRFGYTSALILLCLSLLNSEVANSAVYIWQTPIVGAASSITRADLSANKPVISNASGKIANASGTCNSGTYLRGDGQCAAIAAVTPSYCRYGTFNAFASTNTYVPRFTTAVEACVGSDVSWVDSATLGGSYAIATSGTYTITAGLGNGNVGTANLQIMVGSTITNTNYNCDASETSCRTTDYFVQNQYGSVSWTGYIASGQKAWLVFTRTPSSLSNGNHFDIARVN